MLWSSSFSTGRPLASSGLIRMGSNSSMQATSSRSSHLEWSTVDCVVVLPVGLDTVDLPLLVAGDVIEPPATVSTMAPGNAVETPPPLSLEPGLSLVLPALLPTSWFNRIPY
jgi:hypothetical protein